MSIFHNFFKHRKLTKENGKFEVLEKSSKTGDPFTAISDLQNNEGHVLLQARNKQLIPKISE